MKYFYAVTLAVLVSSCMAHGYNKKLENCRNNTFQVSGKFFRTRIIDNYQNSFPKSITFQEWNSGYDKYRKGRSYLQSRDEIEDADGNKFYTAIYMRVVYGKLKCNKRTYLTLPYLTEGTYAPSIDKRMVFMAVKIGGPLYVFETDKPEVKENRIILKTIREVGNYVTSISVNPVNGDIAIGRRQGNGGDILLIEQIAKDPCETFTETPDAREVQIKNELKYTFKELMMSMGCEDIYLIRHNQGVINACRKMKIFETKLHDKVNDLSKFYTEKIEDRLKQQGESATNKYPDNLDTKCVVENDKIVTLEEAFSSQKNKTKNAQDMLDNLIEGSDMIGGLADDSETDLSVKGNMIDEYSLRNYKCLPDKDWTVMEKNMLAVREQAGFLMLGLRIVKNSFEEEELDVSPE